MNFQSLLEGNQARFEAAAFSAVKAAGREGPQAMFARADILSQAAIVLRSFLASKSRLKCSLDSALEREQGIQRGSCL